MSRPPPNWDDLRPRILTGAALVVVGVVEIWLGGLWFASMAALVTAIIVWELVQMCGPLRPQRAIQLAGLTGAMVLFARALPVHYALPVLAVPAVVGVLALKGRNPRIFLLFAVAVLLAGYGLIVFRDTYDITWFCWLVAVVVFTDIAGYFGGRLIGGKKFWPSVSPKKTWAGILSGWAVSAVIGAVFLTFTDAGIDLIWISVVLSFASQMGDIAQSAVKRRMGVKDSSNLLPGHGGLFDRFDALLGASLFMLLTALIVDVPSLRF